MDGLLRLTSDHPTSGILFCFGHSVVEITHRFSYKLNSDGAENPVKGLAQRCCIRATARSGRTIARTFCTTRSAFVGMLGPRWRLLSFASASHMGGRITASSRASVRYAHLGMPYVHFHSRSMDGSAV
ncbi:hypothetical protein ACFFWD_03610 [Bradyrhizobium erythrophlei]|uniref:hypothetical protein n=1 Tax=Bradyrhizobium erythrophlei TaxID=1437360 RepID=UPI0035E9B408